MITEIGQEEIRGVVDSTLALVEFVPDRFREQAFGQVLALRLKALGTFGISATDQKQNGHATEPSSRTPKDPEVSPRSEAQAWLCFDAIDRTAYPAVNANARVLVVALSILRAGRSLGVEWVLPKDIARVAREKFRLPIDAAAVRMALGRANKYVDRRRDGTAFVYRLAGPGEAYLDSIAAEAPHAQN